MALSFKNEQLKLDTEADADKLCTRIAAFGKFNSLELVGNTIGLPAGERLGKELEKHPNLQHCLWSDIFTGRLKADLPFTIKAMLAGVSTAGAHLTVLDLSDNAFGPVGVPGLSDFLVSESAWSLQELYLNNNGLGAGGVTIADCLIECHRRSSAARRPLQLRVFVAGRNRLENKGAFALAAAFEKIGTLRRVALPQNGIQKEGIVKLAQAFAKNPGLEDVSIADNTAVTEGTLAIAAMLANLSKLKKLNLSDCLCRRQGTLAVLNRLGRQSHPDFDELDLQGCELSANTAHLVIEHFKKWRGPKVHLGTNCYGERFEELEDRVANEGLTEFVTLGEADDDQGEPDDDDGGDEEDAHVEADSTNEDAHGVNGHGDWNSRDPEYYSDEDEEQLDDEYQDEEDEGEDFDQELEAEERAWLDMPLRHFTSRDQEAPTTVFLRLARLVETYTMDGNEDEVMDEARLDRITTVAARVIDAADALRGRPVAPGEQLVNRLIAHADPRGKVLVAGVDCLRETRATVQLERPLINGPIPAAGCRRLLHELLKRGLLARHAQLLRNYLRPMEKSQPLSQNIPQPKISTTSTTTAATAAAFWGRKN